MIDLVLIPFAGGTSLIYEKWVFSSNINLIRIDFKGHGFRIKELLYTSFDEMVKDVAIQIDQNRKNDSIVVFGHSMGGLVTWSIAKELEQDYRIKQLVVSACLPPHLFNESQYEEMTSDEGLADFLIRNNRVTKKRLESRFFCKNLFPAIKNDYKLISTHKHEQEQVLDINIACFYGIQDELMPCDKMNEWERYTNADFMIKGFQGNHFYIEDSNNREEIIAAIESLAEE